MSLIRRIEVKLGQYPARWFDKREVQFDRDARYASITFDDFPASALTEGIPVLASEGVAATFYTAFGLAGTDTTVGYVGTVDELASVCAHGHELGCHTFDHLDCATTPVDTIESSLRLNQATAAKARIPLLRNFAFPFGRYNLAAKRAVMRHYRTARSAISGINSGTIDLGMLKSVPLYARDGAAGWEPFVRELRARPGWLVLRTHDVAASPSPYGCTASELAAAIRRVRETGAEILPIDAVVDRLTSADRQASSRAR